MLLRAFNLERETRNSSLREKPFLVATVRLEPVTSVKCFNHYRPQAAIYSLIPIAIIWSLDYFSSIYYDLALCMNDVLL